MTQGVKRAANVGDADTGAHLLKITQQVSLRQLRSLLRTKDQRVLMLGEVTVKQLAQLNAHWYEALFVALSYNPKRKVLEIDIHALEAQQLCYAEAGIERRKGKGMKPQIRTLDGFPVYKSADMRRREGG